MDTAACALARATPGGFGWAGAGAAWLSALTGWRRRGLTLALGLLATLSLPPLGLWPVLLPSLCGLVWLLAGARSRFAAFGTGWWWAWGFYSVGFYWIGNAMLIEADRFAWMIPFATIGLAGVQALAIGSATWAVHLLKLAGLARILALAGTWTFAEWLRTWVGTGFPWNPIGSIWDAVPAVAQAASVLGVLGLGTLSLLIFTLPALAADFRPTRHKLAALIAAGLLLAGLWAAGGARLAAHPTEAVDGIRLRLVQAAIAQSHKWKDELREAHLLDHLNLSRGPGFDQVTHVVWPETAAPYFLDFDDRHRALVASAAPLGGMVLTGAPRVTPRGVEPVTLWNSLMAIDAAGQVLGIYDKAHLVPFGEYVPLRAVLPIAKITHGGIDFSPGTGPVTLSLPGLPPFAPFICYESVFPGAIADHGGTRPLWLLTVTNDAWFGRSAGPHQHLAAGRMRAIEEGAPLVRAANTGISAVIDPMGRTVARLDLGQRGIVDSILPQATAPTLFSRWGNAIALVLALTLVVTGLFLRRVEFIER
ncbi:Apolipoprotein N-acyltransferase [Magnetospirillum sp. LM-5]|uniref:apolipoprotein N-acyltransferase n=1 Tax=Magnetospirillum sp. LM-5 TaxID=2681466 RepID=UPI00137C981B|nr:apolipoprotein N-acyltransferase [Magnetospirillum sp. LM-5]CAA7618140.1 Apolipoprotein N-acyltransferase [Magnetospirillum sp. LM-5]